METPRKKFLEEKDLTDFSLKIFLFLLGFTALISQTVFYREALIYAFGNEFVFGAVLSVWLLGGAAAGFLCLRIIKVERKKKTTLFSRLLLLLIIFLFLSLLALRLLGVVIIPRGEQAGFFQIFFLCFFTLFPLNFLLVSEFLISLNLLAESRPGAPGLSYFLESLGAFFGALVFTFVIAPNCSPFPTIFFLSFLLALFSFFVFSKWQKVLPLLLILFLILPFLKAGEIEKTTRGMYFGGIVFSKDTPFQNITATKMKHQVEIFLNGQGSGYSFSGRDELRAVFQPLPHFALAFVEKPRQVLMVDGLTIAQPYEILKHPVEKLVVLDLDPEVLKAIRSLYPKADTDYLKDKRIKIVFADARRYLKTTKEKYDAIILSAPEPANTLLSRLYTLEFFKEVKSHLNEGGVFSFSFPSSEVYLSESMKSYNGSLISTAKAVFPEVEVIPSEEGILIASFQEIDFSASKFWEVLDERKVKTQLDPVFVNQSFEKARRFTAQFNKSYITNTDDRPVAIFLSSLIWQERYKTPFKYFQAFLFHYPYLVLSLLLSPFLFLLFKGKQSLSVMFSVSLAGMIAEISLLYLYQLKSGYVYSHISLLLAFFMLGLAAGSYVFKNKKTELLPVALTLFFFMLLSPFSLYINLASLIFYLLLIFTAGFLVGSVFPLSVAQLGKESSSLVYAVDLVGGVVGAFLAGVLMIPLLGVKSSSWLAGFLVLISAVIMAYLPKKFGQ